MLAIKKGHDLNRIHQKYDFAHLRQNVKYKPDRGPSCSPASDVLVLPVCPRTLRQLRELILDLESSHANACAHTRLHIRRTSPEPARTCRIPRPNRIRPRFRNPISCAAETTHQTDLRIISLLGKLKQATDGKSSITAQNLIISLKVFFGFQGETPNASFY